MNVPQLEPYRKQYEEIKVRAETLTLGLTEARFNWRPSPDAWSIEECLAHLVLAGNLMVRNIEAAIDDAKGRGVTGAGPFALGWFDKIALKHTEPPLTRKVPSPKIFRPLHQQPITAVLPSFLHLQGQMLGLMDRAEGLDLSRIKVKLSVPILKLTLLGAFVQVAAHERRHLDQAERVRKQLPPA